MSYDFSFKADLGNGLIDIFPDEDFSCTYNLSPMFVAAFRDTRGIKFLHGLSGAHAIHYIKDAIALMEADAEKYKAMNPANGWGDYEEALKALRKLRDWCEHAPKACVFIT